VQPTPPPVHLNNHHRETLLQIFQHPAGHNIEWRAVLSLLKAVDSVKESQNGKLVVTLGDESEVFEPPIHKDVDIQQIVDLRRMFTNAGYGNLVDKPDAGKT
jgi:hypothetical protein